MITAVTLTQQENSKIRARIALMSMSKRRLATSVWILLVICQTGFADDNYIEFNDDFIFSNAGKKSTYRNMRTATR